MYVSNVHSPVAMYVISDYKIHKNDLTDLSGFKKNFENFHGKYKNTIYLYNHGIYNLSTPNSLCFDESPNSLCFP